MGEHKDLRNKLIYRSCHRGCKENDWLLGSFVKDSIWSMPQKKLNILDNLLEEDDHILFKWMTEKELSPKKYTEIIQIIVEYNKTKKVVD